MKTQFENIAPGFRPPHFFVNDELIEFDNHGTSEGVKKSWESRQRAKAKPEPDQKSNAHAKYSAPEKGWPKGTEKWAASSKEQATKTSSPSKKPSGADASKVWPYGSATSAPKDFVNPDKAKFHAHMAAIHSDNAQKRLAIARQLPPGASRSDIEAKAADNMKQAAAHHASANAYAGKSTHEAAADAHAKAQDYSAVANKTAAKQHAAWQQEHFKAAKEQYEKKYHAQEIFKGPEGAKKAMLAAGVIGAGALGASLVASGAGSGDKKGKVSGHKK